MDIKLLTLVLICNVIAVINCQEKMKFTKATGVNLTSSFVEEKQTLTGIANKLLCSTLCHKADKDGEGCNLFRYTTDHDCIMYKALYHQTSGFGSTNDTDLYTSNLWQAQSPYPTKFVCTVPNGVNPMGVYLLNGKTCRQSPVVPSCTRGAAIVADDTKLFCMGGRDKPIYRKTNYMIDMTMEPEQWTIEDKADILVDFGIVSFGLVQYQRKIILIGGLRGSNAGGTASVFSKQVLIYYLDQDRWEDSGAQTSYSGFVQSVFPWTGNPGKVVILWQKLGRLEVFDVDSMAKVSITITGNGVYKPTTSASQQSFTVNGNEITGVLFMIEDSSTVYYVDFANIGQGPKVLGTIQDYTGNDSRYYGFGRKNIIIYRWSGGLYPIVWWDSTEEKFKTDRNTCNVPEGYGMFDLCVTNEYIDNIPCN